MNLALKLAVNGDRLNRSIAQLAEIGALPEGGVSRLAFSAEDVQARQRVQTWMREAGMATRIDAAGNLIGTYAGQQPELGALVTGSHIDTVAVGGRYDGVLGVLAGLEVVRVLNENGLRLRHSVEVVVFADEERSMIGCKGMIGTAGDDPEPYRRIDGTDIQTALARVGGDWNRLASACRLPAEIAAFVELHVEQGGVLERANQQIGVVTGIVGNSRYRVAITGRANHAGTTPMNQRQDALVAAAQVVLAVNTVATQPPGDQVATVGALTVSPNSVNTVPGRVDLSIDLRDLSQTNLERMVARLQQRLAEIATATQTEITLTPFLQVAPTLAASHIQTAIVEVCEDLGLSYTHLPSRAGHDALEIGRIADMGMIFVPSDAGISHSKDEYTSPDQCTQGANVLLQTFLKLDQMTLGVARLG